MKKLILIWGLLFLFGCGNGKTKVDEVVGTLATAINDTGTSETATVGEGENADSAPDQTVSGSLSLEELLKNSVEEPVNESGLLGTWNMESYALNDPNFGGFNSTITFLENGGITQISIQPIIHIEASVWETPNPADYPGVVEIVTVEGRDGEETWVKDFTHYFNGFLVYEIIEIPLVNDYIKFTFEGDNPQVCYSQGVGGCDDATFNPGRINHRVEEMLYEVVATTSNQMALKEISSQNPRGYIVLTKVE